MDFTFPVCDPQPTCSTTNAIYIGYNAQLQMCTSITGGGDDCLDSGDVCNGTAFTIPDFTGDDTVNISNVAFIRGVQLLTIFFF